MSRIGSTFTTVVVGSPGANAETVIALLGPCKPYVDGAALLLLWKVWVQIGTTGTGYVLNVRRNSLTGARITPNVVGTNSSPAAAFCEINGFWIDNTPDAESVYALTLTPFSTTAASSVSAVMFAAFSL